jgi:hypothetical protein
MNINDKEASMDLGCHAPGDSPLPYNTSETPPTLEVGRPSSTGAKPCTPHDQDEQPERSF